LQEQDAFARFRRALRRSDQLVLDDLFAAAHQHLAAVAYAAHALPFETLLLAMLLEQHKELMRMRCALERICASDDAALEPRVLPRPAPLPDAAASTSSAALFGSAVLTAAASPRPAPCTCVPAAFESRTSPGDAASPGVATLSGNAAASDGAVISAAALPRPAPCACAAANRESRRP
jgi:hypothetical protein